MGFVGCFLSMASTDTAASSRATALRAGLTARGVPSGDIHFEYAFDNPIADYGRHADNLIATVPAGSVPKVLFASCWNTWNELSRRSTLPIVHAGLFHDDEDSSPPINN